jgi:hypothetical protein
MTNPPAIPDTCFILMIFEDELNVGQLYLPAHVAANITLIIDRLMYWAESLCGHAPFEVEAFVLDRNLYCVVFKDTELDDPRKAYASVFAATRH